MIKNIIIALIVIAIIAAVLLYLRKQRSSGVRCVGCPYARECSGKCENKKLQG